MLTKNNKNYILAISCLLFTQSLFADQKPPTSSAVHGLELIAPQDRFVIRIEHRTNGYEQLFDDSSNKVDLGSSLNNIDINSTLMPTLAAFGSGASLGTTQFEADVKTQRTEITLGYGFTENLTVGLIIPYGKVTTNANFSVSDGNIGFNPAFDSEQPISATNSPLLPIGLGATSAVGTEGIQTILNDPSFGFEYNPIQTTSWEGLGDPTLGILWRPYKSSHDALIVGGGLRFGVADDKDPDDLLQQPMDDGTTDLRARIEYYRDLSQEFDLKLTAEYVYQTEDTVTRRIGSNGALLASADSKEKVDRKLGNYYEYDIGIGKTFSDWRYAVTWHQYVKLADQYTSSLNTDTSDLETNTKLFANQWRASISWSGINAWQQKKIPLPLIVQLEMQKTVKAENFPEVTDLYLQITSFF